MKRIYDEIKGKTLKYKNYEGIICGYSNTHFILAVLNKPAQSFRRFDKGSQPFIEDAYKDLKYHYVWCDEKDVNTKLKLLQQ